MQLKELAAKLNINPHTLHARLWQMGKRDPQMLPDYIDAGRGKIRCDYSIGQVARMREYLKAYPVGKPGRPKGSKKGKSHLDF